MKLLAVIAVAVIAIQIGSWHEPAGAAEPNTVLHWRVDDCRFGLRFRDAIKTGRPEASVIALNDRMPPGGGCAIQRPSVDFVRADGSPGGWTPGGRVYRELGRWLYSTAYQEDPSATATGGEWYLTKFWHRGGRDYCAQQKLIIADVDGPANGQLIEDTGRIPLYPGAVCP